MTKLDGELRKEIRAALGDGSRDAKFAFLHRIEDARRDLSSTDVRRTFYAAVKKHGRAACAVCIAATLNDRRDRLDGWGYTWARAVLDLLPGFIPGNIDRAVIRDGIHPTAICEYADLFIRVTTAPTV